MNSKDKETTENRSLEEKVDLLIELVKELLQRIPPKVSTADEGPKDPPPTPPNP